MSLDLRPEPEPVDVSLGALAWAFFLVGVSGFGGVAAPAHAIIVERRRWLSNESYAAVIGVGQVLPGANMMNASVILGDRFAGPLGSLVAATSLLSGPLCILVAVALAFGRWGRLADVQAALTGVAAGAAGLVIGTGLKLARRLRPEFASLLLGGAAFLAVGVARLPLAPTVLALVAAGFAARSWSAS